MPIEGCLVDLVDRGGRSDIDVVPIERRLLGFHHGIRSVDVDVMTVEGSLLVAAPGGVGSVDVDVVAGEVGRSPC